MALTRRWVWLGLTVASLLVGVHSVSAGDDQKSRVSIGVTTARSKMRDGTEVRARLEVAKAVPSKLSHWDYWGTVRGMYPPSTIVTKLVVTMGRDTVLIPFSAYGDLSEPNELWVSCGGAGATVFISGGDAAGGYDATLVVLHGLLYRRRVENGEFPSETWEETVYSMWPDANDR